MVLENDDIVRWPLPSLKTRARFSKGFSNHGSQSTFVAGRESFVFIPSRHPGERCRVTYSLLYASASPNGWGKGPRQKHPNKTPMTRRRFRPLSSSTSQSRKCRTDTAKQTDATGACTDTSRAPFLFLPSHKPLRGGRIERPSLCAVDYTKPCLPVHVERKASSGSSEREHVPASAPAHGLVRVEASEYRGHLEIFL